MSILDRMEDGTTSHNPPSRDVCDECFYRGSEFVKTKRHNHYPDDAIPCPYRNDMDIVYACAHFRPKNETRSQRGA